MKAEQLTPEPIQSDATADILKQKGQLLADWQALPKEHQVSMAIILMDSLMDGEYRSWLQYAMASKQPLRTEQLETTYPTIELTLLDLIRANLDEEQIVQLTPEHLSLISQTMRNHYIHDLFWPEVRHLATVLLENLDKPE